MRAFTRTLGIAVLLLLVALVVCSAQGDKPWERQGTKAGGEIIGPHGGKMVWVPPGEFDMGSNDGEANEKPVHHVRITKGFWLGKYTVTNAQYRRYCQETGSQFPTGSDQGDDYPAVGANWDDAAAYCKHYGLALPTEAQWEYAARGPKSLIYPWGNEWDPKKCCWPGNAGPAGRTFPVGSFSAGASWCGALDMAGNVWQMCSDWYDSKYYAASPAADPTGPTVGEILYEIPIEPFRIGAKVIRGGSWADPPGKLTTYTRSVQITMAGRSMVGFRCAYTP